MNKKIGWAIGALVIALLAVGVYGVSTVFADEGNPPHPFGERGPSGPFGGHSLEGAALEAVAGVLDMNTDDLSAALESGQTLQDLAEQAGVDIQEIKDGLSAVRETEMRGRISQAVTDGTITQEHADWLLEGLDKGFLNDPGFAFDSGSHFGKDTPPSPTK